MVIRSTTQALRVTCVTRYPVNGDYTSITHITAGGRRWTREQAIYQIDYVDKHSFYTEHNGKSAWVGVFEQNGRKYLRTYADNYWNNNLEALPLC
jgi:hypothetical protein